MESDVATISEKINETFLTCTICLELFKAPKALDCLHSFCESCIQDYILKNRVRPGHSFFCPTCRNSSTLPLSGVKGLRSNFLLISLRDTLQNNCTGQQLTKCDLCEVHARYSCCECFLSLCNECSTKKCIIPHQPQGGHKVGSLALLQDTIATAATRDSWCSTHSRPSIMYCFSCCEEACALCAVTKHSSGEHCLMDRARAITVAGAKVDDLHTTAQKLLAEGNFVKEALGVEKQTVRSACMSEVQAIQNHEEYLVSSVKALSMKLQSEVNQIEAMNMSKLDSVNSSLGECLAQAQEVKEVLSAVLQEKTNLNKLELHQYAKNEVAVLCDKFRTFTEMINSMGLYVLDFQGSEQLVTEESFGRLMTSLDQQLGHRINMLTRKSDDSPTPTGTQNDIHRKRSVEKNTTHETYPQPGSSSSSAEPMESIDEAECVQSEKNKDFANYEVTGVSEFCIRTNADKEESAATGVDVLGGHICVIDDNNHLIKYFTFDGTYSHNMGNSNQRYKKGVYDVLALEFPLLAVTGNDRQVALLNSVAGKVLAEKNDAFVGYSGMAKVSHNKFVLTSGSNLNFMEVRSNEQSQYQIIMTNTVTVDFTPLAIAVSPCGVIGMVNQHVGRCMFVDMNGSILKEIATIVSPRSICCDYSGNFLVLSIATNDVHVIGKCLKSVVTFDGAYKLEWPMDMTFVQKEGNSVVVVSEDCGKVKLLTCRGLPR